MRVEVNGVRIYFEVVGEKLALRDGVLVEQPTLLVLHGGPGGDHSSMRPYFDRFSDEYQVIYLDHRGNGRSEHGPREAWRIEQWGDDVKGFCDALEIERPIVLGSSFGGFVAQSYLTRHPDHPSKVVLSSTSATVRFERSLAVYERLGGDEAVELARRTFEEPTLEHLAEFMMVCMPLYRRHPEVELPRRPGLLTPEVLVDFWRNDVTEHDGALKSFDFRGGLLRVRCPVLVLGGEDDPACPIEDQEEIAALIPEGFAELRRFPDCGHGTYLDYPEETEAILREFFAR